MVERAVATWNRFFLKNISDEMALHAPLDEIISIPSVAQLFLPAQLAMSPVYTLCYFSEAVQVRFDGPSGIMSSHRFYISKEMEMALLASEGLVIEVVAKEQILILYEPVMAAVLSFNKFSMPSLRFSPSLSKALRR